MVNAKESTDQREEAMRSSKSLKREGEVHHASFRQWELIGRDSLATMQTMSLPKSSLNTEPRLSEGRPRLGKTTIQVCMALCLEVRLQPLTLAPSSLFADEVAALRARVKELEVRHLCRRPAAVFQFFLTRVQSERAPSRAPRTVRRQSARSVAVDRHRPR